MKASMMESMSVADMTDDQLDALPGQEEASNIKFVV
jgi:hypothetical protein